MSEKEIRLNELNERIKKLEELMFYEQMADFMDWGKYGRLEREYRACVCERRQLMA